MKDPIRARLRSTSSPTIPSLPPSVTFNPGIFWGDSSTERRFDNHGKIVVFGRRSALTCDAAPGTRLPSSRTDDRLTSAWKLPSEDAGSGLGEKISLKRRVEISANASCGSQYSEQAEQVRCLLRARRVLGFRHRRPISNEAIYSNAYQLTIRQGPERAKVAGQGKEKG